MIGYDIRTNKVNILVELYRNRREKLAIIPLEYIEKFSFKFNEISEISIDVPKYKMRNNQKVENRLYNLIKSRQQVVVTITNAVGEETKQRFTLSTQKRTSSKPKSNKSFIAYSWEKTIERQRIDIPALTRQLKTELPETSEGILDLIASKVGWNIGYVDEEARCKYMEGVESFKIDLFNNFSIANVTDGGLIYEKDINITVPLNKPLYITFNYTELKTYNNEDGKELSGINVVNTLEDPIYTSITKVQAYHLNTIGNRYGIKYIFTLIDGVKIEKECVFTNIIDKKISCNNINITYDFGDIIKKYNVQYNNFEAYNDNAYKLLKDIQDVFDCYFIFNTMTNTINCYAKKNFGENKGFLLSLDTNVVNIETTEAESIPTALKVTGKDGLDISAENPEGTDTIHNYDYYINNNIISDELKSALVQYNTLLVQKQKEWSILKDNRIITQQKDTQVLSEAQSLESRIKTLNNLLSAYISSKDAENQARIKNEKDPLETRYKQLLKIRSDYDTYFKELDDAMAVISDSIRKEKASINEVKIFTEEDLIELNEMEEVENYDDDYYTLAYGLYNNAVKVLKDKIKPQYDFKLTTENLCTMIHHPKGWNYILELGNTLNFNDKETIDEIGEKEVRFTEMTIVPVKVSDDETKVQIKDLAFSNKTNKLNPARKSSNVGKVTNKASGLFNQFKLAWEESLQSNSFVKDALTKGLDIQASNIKGGVYRNLLHFSEAGCFIIDSSGDRKNQLYLEAE
jgi:hypothetical protein